MRCFVNCFLVTPPVVGRRIPLSRIGLRSGYALVAFYVLCSERVGLKSTVGANAYSLSSDLIVLL